MRSQNNQGFGLVEVMVALAIAALIITPVFVTMSTAIRTVGQRSSRYNRCSDAQNLLIELVSYLHNGIDHAPEKIAGISINSESAVPATLLSLDGLRMARADISWREGRLDKKDTLAYIYYLPAKEPKS